MVGRRFGVVDGFGVTGRALAVGAGQPLNLGLVGDEPGFEVVQGDVSMKPGLRYSDPLFHLLYGISG